MQLADSIAKQFFAADHIVSTDVIGNGLINDTYLVETTSGAFVMQKINSVVFPKPAQIVANLSVLNEHIHAKPDTVVKLTIPAIIPTLSQQQYYIDPAGQHWRVINYIANTKSFERIENEHQAQQVGFALGHFHALFYDLPTHLLSDTLPGFHITPNYLKQYDEVIHTKKAALIEQDCHALINSYRHYADTLENAKHSGQLAMRVIHGDPKLNNILFACDTREAVSIIDLDTVKPGLIQYDIGDCLRSCCNSVSIESEMAHFDRDRCEIILKSYLKETQHFLTKNDISFIYVALLLITFELGLRFFTDFLAGNHYFKVSFPEQNLHRARQQFSLLQSINKQRKPIVKLINSLASYDASNSKLV